MFFSFLAPFCYRLRFGSKEVTAVSDNGIFVSDIYRLLSFSSEEKLSKGWFVTHFIRYRYFLLICYSEQSIIVYCGMYLFSRNFISLLSTKQDFKLCCLYSLF